VVLAVVFRFDVINYDSHITDNLFRFFGYLSIDKEETANELAIFALVVGSPGRIVHQCDGLCPKIQTIS
jgi:hypothetical protein